MSSFFGQHVKLALFGQSHGEAIGVTIDGFPAGMTIDMEALRAEMARRAPGASAMTTARWEADEPEILSGVMDGRTTGQPVCAVIRNTNTRSQDYGEGVDLLRPGHADYTGHVRYFGFEDWRGGGHFSGRLTAPIVFAGALCRQYLQGQGVEIAAHIQQLGALRDRSFLEAAAVDMARLRAMALPTLTPGLAARMEAEILRAKAEKDSVGGVIECMITGAPAGLGAPFFDSVESVLAHLMFSVPAVKGVAFGEGFGFAELRGSQANDAFRLDEAGRVVTESNRCGGVLGGITDGMPVVFRCCVRATPSVAQRQRTVSVRRGAEEDVEIHGRHDPCILPRAVPVIEAMAAIGMMELWKERAACVR